MSKELFQAYREFIIRVDSLCDVIFKKYGHDMKCAPGCVHCCEGALTLFPLEAYFIRHNMDDTGEGVRARSPGQCIFLREGLCSIYTFRPLVCRTQGFPLLYGSDEPDQGMEISFCDLNFTDTESVDEEDLLDMDRLNLVLAALNLRFLGDMHRLEEIRDTRIAMEDIHLL